MKAIKVWRKTLILPDCVNICNICVPKEAREGTSFLGAGVARGCEPLSLTGIKFGLRLRF